MKPAKKITRVQLKVSGNDDKSIIGIVTSEADYKLSLTLNRILGISLRYSDSLEVADDSGIIRQFSRFADISNHEESYSLISNRADSEVLIKKHPKLDYFFRIESDEEETDIETITEKLRPIGNITALFVLKKSAIKGKNVEYLF